MLLNYLSNFWGAVQVNPKNATAWTRKGIALRWITKYKEAIEAFDSIIGVVLIFYDIIERRRIYETLNQSYT